MLNDPKLAPFFKKSNVAQTKRKKKLFMNYLLGGSLA